MTEAALTRTFTVNISSALNYLYNETADGNLVRAFASEFFDLTDDSECDPCGWSTPSIEIGWSGETVCALCGNPKVREFSVTFTFSVNVKAANETDAEALAENVVSVDVSYSEYVEDNMDLEVSSTSEAF